MKRPIPRLSPLMISVLLGATGAYLPTAGATGVPPAPALHEDVAIAPARSLTPQEETILSHSAARVLQHVAAARAAIHEKKADRATAELVKAQNLINIIKAARPTIKVTDRIWLDKKHFEYKDTQVVPLDSIPIEAALTDIADVVPMEKLRQHVATMKKTKKAAKAKGLEALQDALVYTEVDLPLASTEEAVIRARTALADKDFKTADRVLAMAQEGVKFLSIAIESPMTAARNALAQANQDYAAKKYDLVEQDLVAAKAQLARAVKSADALTRREAKRLEDGIAAVENQVAAGGKDTARAIEGLWDRTVALAEREAGMARLGWSKYRATTQARAALIEAKQHVAFAENLAVYAKADPKDIFKALDDAAKDLREAQADTHLSRTDQDEIARLIGAVDALHKDLEDRAAYSAVREELRKMIDRL